MINSKKTSRLLLLVGIILTVAKPALCQNPNNEVYVIDKTVSSYTGVSYRALNSITLAPGFSFTPSTNSPVFSASIGFSAQTQDDPNMVINNTVRTDIVKVAGITSEWQINSSNSQTILSYMDGLGRPLQRVTVQGSPLQKDVIQFMSYDQYGQQSKQYLPYVAGTNDGSFQANPQSAQQNFYQTTGNQIATDSYPFAVTTYDNSPLGRVLESGAPGADWQPGNHTVKNLFRLNSTADHIMIWNTSGPTNSYYGETQLSVNDVTDENGNHILSFTNKLGQQVAKKVQADATGTWLETIYIYDDVTNLSYQVSPEGVKRIYAGTANWDASFIATWATAYTYDAQNRLVAKQAPGAAPVYLVYDGNNRLVLMQDGKLRNAYGSTDKWNFIKYDVAGRVVISGLYSFVDPGVSGSSNREKLQNYLDGLVYDNISTFAYEVRAAGTTYGYSNQAFPTTLQNADVMAVNYYDDYDFNNNGNPPNQYVDPGKPGFNTAPATEVSGFLTGTLKRVIGSNNWIKEAIFYDQFGNAIQKQSNNLINQNGLDITSNAIDVHAGHIIQTIQFKSVSNTSVSNKLTYDLMDRLSQVALDVNNGGDKVIAKYEYNELGQLKDKKLHQKSNGAFLQTLDYRYNIRGWLTGINNSSLSNADGVNAGNDDIFGMTFLYNQADVSGLSNTQYYNGKISAIKWKANDQFSSSSNPVRERSYTYTYDKVDRLIAANYSANSGSGWNAEVNAYNETIGGYDYNGNILSLQRNAQADDSHAPVQIDNLVYNYINGASNQLSNVNDLSGNSVGFNDGANSTNEYTYDANGNLITDANKGETITYNDLNKVASITTSAGTVQYTYDASGTRIRKTVYNPATSSTTTYDYLDGFVYTNSALSYFSTAEGRAVAGSSSFTYEYFIKDHLGNVRVSFQDDGNGTAKIVQENEYYAFGMTMQGVISRTAQNTTANNNLFNGGSELQNDLGFENSYSTFYREYDPVLGRFNSIDPAVDKYAGWSPYNFAFNDPVGLNDPMGDDPQINPGFNQAMWDLIEWAWRSAGEVSMSYQPDQNGNFHGEPIQENNGVYGYYKYTGWEFNNPANPMAGFITGANGVDQGNAHHTFEFVPINFPTKPASETTATSANQGGFPNNWTGGYETGYPGMAADLRTLGSNFAEGFMRSSGTNAYSGSFVSGYMTIPLTGIKNVAPDVASIIKAFTISKLALRTVQGLGLASTALTVIEDVSGDHGFTWGTAAKIGIGVAITFTPYGWVYGVVDIGFQIYSGTSLTDRISNGIDNLNKR